MEVLPASQQYFHSYVLRFLDICFHNKMLVEDFNLTPFSSLGEICTLLGWYCPGIQVCFVRPKFRSKNTDLLDFNKVYSRQAKEHISKYHFTPGSWSQLFLTLPLRSVRRSQAIYEDIYTTHNLTVPIVYHFVICIFTSITSKLFMTSKL